MNNESPSETLDDQGSDDVTRTYDRLRALEQQQPYLSWSEAKIMHSEGVFDFQSHTMTHDTVFTSNQVVDFVNPSFRRVPHKIPLMQDMPKDPWRRSEALGMPLYTVAPRLTGARRYLHDEQIRQSCLNIVRSAGADRFFQQPNWRAQLNAELQAGSRASQTKGNDSDEYESDQQRDDAIRSELRDSKVAIESQLGNTVQHLCFPFYAGSELASDLSAELGYKSNHWGWKPASDARTQQYGRDHLYSAIDETDYSTGTILQQRRTNSIGDDPFRIVRLPGDYIVRLPGEGRRSLLSMFVQKCIRNLRKA